MTPQETFIVAFATIVISIVLLIGLTFAVGRFLSTMTEKQATVFFVLAGILIAAAIAFGVTVDIHNGVAG